ncbi:hypothetical protein NDU88_007743 [Pleurodeles waltl]|uniref:Myb/SANT-like DNA-binding domain-containing protein n=1 Tax=Pleurodeles waltl TaxID=8319 RepID=A0AAV7PM66_PLEWA|nr:hypothetical protein NDU88_007743 [Pleurodeles waltl]
MMEEIVRVEPQLFGSQVHHTSIARKMELWRRIVDRVNAVGQHPRNREDIRKRWNDLRGKDYYLTLPDRRVQTSLPHPQKRPTLMIAALANWIQMTSPDHRGPRDSLFPSHRHSPTLTFHPLETPVQHPPSGPIPPSPGHVNQLCVHHYREPRITHHPNNNRDLGAVAVGTRSRGRRHRSTGELGGLLCDRGRTDQGNPLSTRPSPPSWEHTTTPRRRWLRSWPSFRRSQRMQEEQYLGFREELRTIITALGTIVGVLKDIQNTMRDTVALQGPPDTSMDDEMPTTSAGASGQDAPPQDHHTSTPPPADGEPPRKWSLGSRNRTEHDGKAPTKKLDHPDCHPTVPLCNPVHIGTAPAPLPMSIWAVYL